ncbi:MAG: UbiA family prenyltransferase [Alphaproteobacteria bacterium]
MSPLQAVQFREIPQPREVVPLFVDIDGTLIKTDLLFECFLQRLRRRPWSLLAAPLWLVRGRAAFKSWLAAGHDLAPAMLPFNGEFLHFLHEEAGKGRTIMLASAADAALVGQMADHLGFVSGVLATDDGVNLKGVRKLTAILEHTGRGPFDYAGNDPDDVPIWAAARKAIVVNPSRRVERQVQGLPNVAAVFPGGRSISRLIEALRPHQWLKNLLVFVPLLTSISFLDSASWVRAVLAFVAFSAAASATYVFNDLMDVAADRRHPKKRARPIAAGDVSVPLAGVIAAALLGLSFAVAAGLAPAFVWLLAGYVLLATAYSLKIKSYVIADVIALAGLYCVRVLAGAAAIGVTISFWLFAFSVFLFASLALVKRAAELVSQQGGGLSASPGRDYRSADLWIIAPLGTGLSAAAVLVLALYVNAPEVAGRFATPELLWLLLPTVLYWLGRLWIKTARGEMYDDPIVFSVRDRATRVIIPIVILIFVAAALLDVPTPVRAYLPI